MNTHDKAQELVEALICIGRDSDIAGSGKCVLQAIEAIRMLQLIAENGSHPKIPVDGTYHDGKWCADQAKQYLESL